MAERPSFYVHFEFGMSWTPRHAPRNRQVTYMSKNMRDRANQFPRQLPPTNTNFLAAPVAYPYQQNYQAQEHQHPVHQGQNITTQQTETPCYDYYARDYSQQYHQQQRQEHQQRQQSQQAQDQESDTQRSSRSQSRGSHERGSSAPPPFNGSPWDADPEPMMATALPRSSRTKPRPQVWKALPATPDQFRLGEDNLPWDSYNFPAGYVEDGEVTASDSGTTSRRQIEYPPESSRRRDVDDRDRGRTREMQSLATALLTVDNGFEDQWWYQGPRLVTIAGDLFAQAPIVQPSGRDGTIGWAVSQEDRQLFPPRRESLPKSSPRTSAVASAVDIVSPVSDFSSPVSSYQGLRRSLTTRSDELHM